MGYAQTATITGIILDEQNQPIPNANINTKKYGTYTDSTGYYILQITADQKTTITFSHIGHKNVILNSLVLNTNETYEFNPVLKTNTIQVDEVTVTATGEKKVDGVINLSTKQITKIPGANAGVETILKLLPGVNSNNELSTQYAVRGGNYDENLIYINEIEVYKPFLIRSAQQEGLSSINTNMVQSIKFSSGGFQAKYGDKLSSSLNITYKTPVKLQTQIDLSLLGASATLETASKNKKLTSITGVRYRNNNLFLNSTNTNANFNPTFADIQSYFTYKFSEKFRLNLLGNISINDYKNEPLNRETNFGTINNPQTLVVHYQGQENNRYNTALGAIKGKYYVNDNLTFKAISSIYHTTEEEYSDVIAAYRLGAADTDLNDTNISKGIGSQYNRARNDLDALLFNFEVKGMHRKNNKVLEMGIKYTHEDIRDQLRESEFIDSVGFSIRPPLLQFINDQPNTPFTAPLVPFTGINATNFVKTNRFSGYLQYSNTINWNQHSIYYNVGIRSQYWTVSGTGIQKKSHAILSPRFQFAWKPNWEKDMLFRVATGVYHQPPFYRELRNQNGIINPNVKAQKAIHIVAGNEYSFLLWERPFTLISEIYYKKISNVNPYTLEDVRIRYAALNNAKAYAYGTEVRLNGAFVPGTESWISIGYLKTEENIDNRGYIFRPTDQRLKFGILFQDYVPNMPQLKMYLNLVYNTGVPGGSPSYADSYIFQKRLRDYKRADLGISHIFVDADKKYPKNHWLHGFKDLSVGIEIFNLFNNQNSITNTWVRDVDSKQQYAIPNFMTSRVLNLKLSMRL
ncbi:outer membrane receptor protein involved in Fe transport [Maribacter vaceletii]|uniref:Outer membrane receptor protein involved in Fe transport n=1 Tax=Maribacter vaceletii TaxID=1206816 RepID=A0A495DVG1_9FLAO|nr:TonB-dependent receptor [Maribacter vaceletii]RKR07081.1 outer membrane receptor protein involved in Fe transport [Maribacter vaceletii]